MRRRTTLIPAAAGALALLAAGFAPAQAADPDDEVMTGLAMPLSVATTGQGVVFASENRIGQITMSLPGGGQQVIYTDADHREIGGLSVNGTNLLFTATVQGGKHPVAKVYSMDLTGTPTELADLWAYEKKHNPDGKVSYGLQGLSKSCKAAIPKKSRGEVLPPKGELDSHPYSTINFQGVTYVADAAGNDVLAIGDDGKVSTVAVLPAVKVKVDKGLRTSLKLPKCTQGKTFKGQPVPTDIEGGPDGKLYVTTLGGALGESMPVGGLHTIDPATGAVVTLTGALMSPTGLAIGNDGTTYISQLFAQNIITIPFGSTEVATFAEVPFPGDIDVVGTDVYATLTDLTNPGDGSVPPDGKVVHWSTASTPID
jgi:hypothetical protein